MDLIQTQNPVAALCYYVEDNLVFEYETAIPLYCTLELLDLTSHMFQFN
jgi:hypothetical protein